MHDFFVEIWRFIRCNIDHAPFIANDAFFAVLGNTDTVAEFQIGFDEGRAVAVIKRPGNIQTFVNDKPGISPTAQTGFQTSQSGFKIFYIFLILWMLFFLMCCNEHDNLLLTFPIEKGGRESLERLCLSPELLYSTSLPIRATFTICLHENNFVSR